MTKDNLIRKMLKLAREAYDEGWKDGNDGWHDSPQKYFRKSNTKKKIDEIEDIVAEYGK